MLEVNFTDAVEVEKFHLLVQLEAKRQISEEYGRFRPVDLTNKRTEPEDIVWRVEDLLPANGYVLIQARRKSGKTTLVGNLIKALTSGGRFLGEFEARGFSRVALLDLEMSENRHKHWLREMGLLYDRKLYTDYLRGRAASLVLFDDERRHELAQHLTDLGIDVLIVDPLGPLLRAYGVDENSNSEVGRVVDALVKLKEESGVSELVVTHHQGKDGGQGARGASVLEDTPDAIWTMSGPANRPADKLSAFGRDVDETRLLSYDPETRALSSVPVDDSDDDTRGATNTNAILFVIAQDPGISLSAAYESARKHGYTGNKERFTEDLKALEASGQVENRSGGTRQKWYITEAD
jgi:hypothetical protein